MQEEKEKRRGVVHVRRLEDDPNLYVVSLDCESWSDGGEALSDAEGRPPLGFSLQKYTVGRRNGRSGRSKRITMVLRGHERARVDPTRLGCWIYEHYGPPDDEVEPIVNIGPIEAWE